jgi:Transglycosylase SLT domain
MWCFQERFGALAFACILSIAAEQGWGWWNPEVGIYQEPVEARPQAQSFRSGSIGIARTHPWESCLQTTAKRSGVHPALFHAIVKVESGRHPYAFGWYDAGGTWRSYRAPSYTDAVARFLELERRQIRFDVGLAQVSSRNLTVLQRRVGVSPIKALDPCSNLYLAGVILKEQIRIHGSTWKAVAGYNGALTYAPRVYRAYCSQVPDALHCRTRVPLPHLLSYPLPVLQTRPAPQGVHYAMGNADGNDSPTKIKSEPS